MSDRRDRSRHGFALLAVLWMTVGLASLGLAITFAARESIAASRNRAASTRATWRAHDCLERARVAVDEALRSTDVARWGTGSPWLFLDTVVKHSGLVTDVPCHLEMRPVGTVLDVNQADDEMVRMVLRAAGVPFPRADSMTDALLDWRDGDDIERPSGAEETWYTGAHRPVPRNGLLAADAEIALVRGFAAEPGVDSLLGVEPGRILLFRAPLPVIAALPGIGEEALARIAEARGRATPISNLMTLAASLSSEARSAILARSAELSRLTTAEPDAWVIESHGRFDGSRAIAVVEVRLVRAGARAAIVRRRAWAE